jgi:hypothetical protein
LNALLELVEAASAQQGFEESTVLLREIQGEISGVTAVGRHGQSARAAEGVVILLVRKVDAERAEDVDELIEALGTSFDFPGQANAWVWEEGKIRRRRATRWPRTAE